MSFVITIHVREGIVMASDSRMTLNTEEKTPKGKRNQIAVGMSDSNYKTFLSPSGIGISVFGAAAINGIPIGGFIESLIRDELENEKSVEVFASKFNEHFRTYDPVPDVGLHVAGYEETEKGIQQRIFTVFPYHNKITRTNPDKPNGEQTQGATWNGIGDILARLVQQVYLKDQEGNYKALPYFRIPWQFFTLQDAIDFAVYAIRTTIDSVRFLPRAKTVGGPIDVLVVKPNESFWVSRKVLKKN